MMLPAAACELPFWANAATIVGAGASILAFGFLAWRYNKLKQEEISQVRRSYADSLIARAGGVEGCRANGDSSEYVVMSALVGLRDFPEYLPVMDRMLEYFAAKGAGSDHYRRIMVTTIAEAEMKLSKKARAVRQQK